ncbi:MAG: AI-2E family transporter [Desulfotalea sp.]
MDQIPEPLTPQNQSEPGPLRIKYFLIVFSIGIFFLGRILWPFWAILVLSFLLTNIFRPIYLFLEKKMSPHMASSITCLMIFALVFLPLLFFTGALTGEALGLYNWVRDANVWLKLQHFIQDSPRVAQIQGALGDFGINLKPSQMIESLSYVAKSGGLFIYNQASSWAANILQFVALFFIMILVIFFLLIDMPKLKNFIIRLSPLPDDEDKLLIEKFDKIANAILKGNGICGIIQGVAGGVVFSILGLNSPLLWGCIMAILAFLPIFGIGLVMLPAALILVIGGHVGSAIFLGIFYILLSFGMEYLVKPKLVGSQVKMHTLLVVLAIMGGLSVYGILGIIYGPLIVTAFLTLSDIYLKKYDQYIQKM